VSKYADRKARGCAWCGTEPLPGHTLCAACRDKARERDHAARRARGVVPRKCRACGGEGHYSKTCGQPPVRSDRPSSKPTEIPQ